MLSDVKRATRVVVLTALQVECQAMLEQLSSAERVDHAAGTLYEVGRLRDSRDLIDVAVAEIGKGARAAAAHYERAISAFEPAACLFVGIAGSLKPQSVGLGDVVVASKVYAYQGGKAAEEFLARPELFYPDHRLEQAARLATRSSRWLTRIARRTDPAPAVHVEALATGDLLVEGGRDVQELLRRHYNDAVAVEMEGAGFLDAARLNGTPALVIRGISDLARAKGATDAAGWQQRAAHHAAAFAADVLTRLAIAPEAPRGDAEREGTVSITVNGNVGRFASRDYYEGHR